MKLDIKCMPQGSLPYTNAEHSSRMLEKLFANTLYLPNFPLTNKSETVLYRTLDKIPAIKKKGNKFILESDQQELKKKMAVLDEVFNNTELANQFLTDSFFTENFKQIILKRKPKNVVISLVGPFTISQILKKEDDSEFFADKLYRKYLIQLVCVKSLAYANLIKNISKETRVIIMLEEAELKNFGNIKRENEDIDLDVAVSLYSKIIDKLHAEDIVVGIQSFGKCDWNIAIDAGVDIISFDAYNNPNNLNIFASKVNEFLSIGGYINWGFVPVSSEEIIKNLKIDDLYNRLIKTFEGLINEGVVACLVYNNSMVSVLGDMDKLPIMFAEKALILSKQLAKKIPTLQ